jgi:glycylpeptide N-tetradecanoyltransferase
MASNQEQIESFAASEEQDMPASEEAKDSGDEDMIEFWNAQPAESIKENTQIEEGPLKMQIIEDISREPTELPPGIEWCTLDPTNGEEMNDLWELLNGQYVEDDDAMFRFNYSKGMLRWYVFTVPPSFSNKCVGN